MFLCNIALYSIRLTSITSHIHSWVLFLLWFRLFIPSAVISPFFSSSILGTYRSGKFIFQCPIFLPFHTVHGVLKARMLKWFAIPFSSGPRFVRSLYHDPSVLAVLHGCTRCPYPATGHHQPTPRPQTPGHTEKSGSGSCGVTAPVSWVLVHTGFACALQISVSLVLCKFWH